MKRIRIAAGSRRHSSWAAPCCPSEGTPWPAAASQRCLSAVSTDTRHVRRCAGQSPAIGAVVSTQTASFLPRKPITVPSTFATDTDMTSSLSCLAQFETSTRRLGG